MFWTPLIKMVRVVWSGVVSQTRPSCILFLMQAGRWIFIRWSYKYTLLLLKLLSWIIWINCFAWLLYLIMVMGCVDIFSLQYQYRYQYQFPMIVYHYKMSICLWLVAINTCSLWNNIMNHIICKYIILIASN